MIYKEEHVLFPTSLDMLTDSEWIKVKEGEAAIGFAWVEPDRGWPQEIIVETEAAVAEPEDILQDVAGALGLDTGRMTMEQINLISTHLPAQTFGLYKKGILREKHDTDVVIFDPETAIDYSTFDEPTQPPADIHRVIVNGELAMENGQVIGATSGQVLRRG